VRIVLNGLTQVEFDCAGQLEALWSPSSQIVGRSARHSVSAEILRLAGEPGRTPEPTAVVGVHTLGGTGICVLTPGPGPLARGRDRVGSGGTPTFLTGDAARP
jgi:hypothetical protein